MKLNLKNKNIPFIICIFSVITLCVYVSFSLYNSSKIQKSSFRLHVVANSNSEEDQILKLKVSDKVENYINENTKSLNDKKDIYSFIYTNISEIFNIANTEIKNNNMNYTSKIKIGKIHYEEKENVYINMDSGSYDSVQILIGDAKGENYWNLIFPNKDSMDNLKNLENILPNISNIYNENYEVKEKEYKLKIFEILNILF